VITAASEAPLATPGVGTAHPQQVCAAAELPGMSRTSNLGRIFFGLHGHLGDGRQRLPRSGVEKHPTSPPGLPAAAGELSALFRPYRIWQAISTFQRNVPILRGACDLLHATTFFCSRAASTPGPEKKRN